MCIYIYFSFAYQSIVYACIHSNAPYINALFFGSTEWFTDRRIQYSQQEWSSSFICWEQTTAVLTDDSRSFCASNCEISNRPYRTRVWKLTSYQVPFGSERLRWINLHLMKTHCSSKGGTTVQHVFARVIASLWPNINLVSIFTGLIN